MQDALTSTNFCDETGHVTVNVVDAMMQIANAIHRLAEASEGANARMDMRAKRMFDAVKAELQTTKDDVGHA